MKTISTVDLFCGAGGAAEGMRQAINSLGWAQRGIAVNHWDVAIETMRKNHQIDSLCSPLETIVPADAVQCGEVDLLWASPSCTHHSRARGGRPLSNQLRSQPELILTWLDQLFVRRLIVENVPEFVSWGPLGKNGRPLESLRGACFQAWVAAIEARNYKVEWRILNCADYGDATTRKRFFLQAVRRGCGRLEWPAATHAAAAEHSLFGVREQWRPVRDCLDLTDLGELVSRRKRPLSPRTMERITAGIRKHYGGQFVFDFFRGDGHVSTHEPLRTQTGRDRFALVTPLVMGKQSSPAVRLVDEACPTITASGNLMLLTPVVMGQQSCAVPRQITKPCPTVSTAGAISLSTPVVQSGKIVDLYFRMLKPSELARVHSFPDNYEITGNKSEQIKQIGNSVPVATARALCTTALCA